MGSWKLDAGSWKLEVIGHLAGLCTKIVLGSFGVLMVTAVFWLRDWNGILFLVFSDKKRYNGKPDRFSIFLAESVSPKILFLILYI